MKKKLPPWSGDDRAMLAWLDARLHEKMEAAINDANKKGTNIEDVALYLARTGHPGMLRQLYPHIADCIHSPPRRKGERRRLPPDSTKFVAEQVKAMRQLWRENYGRVRRQRDQKSAAWFAASIWGVDEEAVERALRGSGTSRAERARRKKTRAPCSQKGRAT